MPITGTVPSVSLLLVPSWEAIPRPWANSGLSLSIFAHLTLGKKEKGNAVWMFLHTEYRNRSPQKI